jgi:citrate lyase beta subunit
VEKAHTRGADAYILDLEDSVPIELKVTTRKKSQSSGIKLIAKWCRCAGQN